MSRITTVYRVHGRYASSIDTPSGRRGFVSGGKLYVENPPQLDWCIWKGSFVSLVPINNRTPCWRESDGIIGQGKDKDRHDHNAAKNRRHVSRIVSSLQNADIPPAGLWKKAGLTKRR